MPTGIRKCTYKWTQRNQHSQRIKSNLSERNLKKQDLGGVIFGCTRDTMGECLSKQIFGLPAGHFSYIKNIEPGLPLFLFNYTNRELHGIFEAASLGEMNIDPYGWTKDGTERTQYPAQVRICIKMNCRPLSEEQFKKIIHDNYYKSAHFWFELDHVQTTGLISMFESLSTGSTVTAFPYNTTNRRTLCSTIRNSYARHAKECSESLLPKEDCPDHEILSKDNNLFEEKPPETSIKDENLMQMTSEETGFNRSLQLNTEIGFSGPTFLKKEHKLLDAYSNREVERVILKLKQLALSRDHSNYNPEYDAEGNVAPCVMADNTADESAPETPSVSEKCEDVFTNTSDLDSFTNQAYSDLLLQQQSHDKLLESQLDPYMACNNELPNLQCHNEEDRFHSGCDALIFVMGGYDGISWLSTTDCYSSSRDIVRSLKPMSSVRSYAFATVLNGNIYNCGGENGNSWFDTVEFYSPSTDKWTLCPPLSEKKGCLAGATLHDKIYAVGGGNGIDCFSEVEMFDPALGRWIPTQSMLHKRFSPAAVELNGALYVVGGFNGSNYLKSAERLDPREVSWSKLESMHTSRGCHSLAVLNEKLYVFGGNDWHNYISSVEVFDPRIGSWMNGEEMKQSRGFATSVVIGETIYLLGGLTEGPIIADRIECYKEGQGWWKANLKGIGKRCFFSATVL